MAIKDSWSVQQLVAATQQLHAARLHEHFSDSDYFLIRTPKLDSPAVAMLMGQGREAFGLNVFLGQGAMATTQSILTASGESQAHRAMMQASMIGYQMSDARDLTHDARRWLKKAKVKPRGHQWYPDPMSIEPGKVPVVLLADRQSRLLLHLVRGILAAAEDKAFKPCGEDRNGRVLCISLDDDTQNPTAQVTWESVATAGPGANQRSDDNASAALPAARFDLAGLNSNDDTWLAALIRVPGSIAGDDLQPYMLVVCSKQTCGMWPSLLMGAAPEQIIDALSALMRGEADSTDQLNVDLIPPPAGLPARLIAATADLHEIVRHIFEPLDVECINGEDNPQTQALLDSLEASFDMGMTQDGELEPSLDYRIPDADDLEGWKRVDGWIKDEMFRGFDEDDRYLGTRALNRYFGADADAMHLLRTYRQVLCIDSYAHWFAISYRTTRKQPTLAEQWLADAETAEPVKVLVKSMIATGPSIYRVEEADEDTGKITLTDLFTGELTIATDFGLSTCLYPGIILPAKLVAAGDFHFFYPAGPMMSSVQLDPAMTFFDDQGLTPSPELFADQPHLLGQLWDFIDQLNAQPLNLCNGDGHDLVFHTAVFSCPDTAALERRLDEHAEFERDPEAPDAWVWFRQGAYPPKPPKPTHGPGHAIETQYQSDQGARTLLGQLFIDDDRLTLRANSRERIDAAHALLERMGELTVLSVEANELSESDNSELPDDSASPGQRDLEGARAYLLDHYQQWLDYPLPSLNDKTPRQAAKDKKLRPRLSALIRSIPDITDPSDGSVLVAAPREMLLKELDL